MALIGVSAVALSWSGAAMAQQASSDGIAEITVTAQKITEKVQDVPIAVGVVSAASLEKQGIQNINDVAGQMPNVEVILPFGAQEPQFTIRGVTETDFNPNQSSPIAMYVDGVFKSVGALQALQLFDTERVEVEKGPQGTLQGRNATGGAVSIYSIAPVLDELSGNVKVGVGDYGRYETNGAINVPIIDNTLAMRFAYTFTNVDGYEHNLAVNAPYSGNLNGEFDYGGRLSFLYKPTSDLEVILRLTAARSDPVNYGEYSKGINAAGEGIPPGASGYLNSVPANLYSATGYARQNEGYYDGNVLNIHRKEIKSHGVDLEVNYNIFDVLKFTSITGYDQGQWRTHENDGGAPVAVDDANYFSRVHSFQEEMRFASSFDGPYNFVFGALYSQESLFLSEYTYYDYYQPAIVQTPGGPVNLCLTSYLYTCDLQDSFNQRRVDYALYLSNTYRITDNLKATVGARWTADWVGIEGYNANLGYIDNTNNNTFTNYNVIPGNGLTNTGAGFTNQTVSNHKWSGKIGLDYHLTPDNMVYASWNLGFRGSAFSGSALDPSGLSSVKPETLIDYEVGSKNVFFDRKLEVNLAGFYYVYRNQQFAGLDASGLSQEVNIAKVNSEGVEAEFKVKPMRDLTVTFNAGYIYAIYSSGAFEGLDVTGNRVEEAPHWSLSGTIDWKAYRSDWGDIDWYLDAHGYTKQWENTPFNSDTNVLEPGYSVFNSRITTTLLDGSTDVSLWVQNLFDEHYDVAVYDYSYTGYVFALRNNPRAYGLQAAYHF